MFLLFSHLRIRAESGLQSLAFKSSSSLSPRFHPKVLAASSEIMDQDNVGLRTSVVRHLCQQAQLVGPLLLHLRLKAPCPTSFMKPSPLTMLFRRGIGFGDIQESRL